MRASRERPADRPDGLDAAAAPEAHVTPPLFTTVREDASRAQARIWRRSLGGSVLVHVAVLAVLLRDDGARIARYLEETRRSVRAVVRQHSAVGRQLDAELQRVAAAEAFDRLDVGRYVLALEYAHAGMAEEDVATAAARLDALSRELTTPVTTEGEALRALHELMQYRGRYVRDACTLTELLRDGGNCEARAKLLLALCQRVAPGVPLSVQVFADHVVVLAQLGADRYALDGLSPTLLDDGDLTGTTLLTVPQYLETLVTDDARELIVGSAAVVGGGVLREAFPGDPPEEAEATVVSFLEGQELIREQRERERTEGIFFVSTVGDLVKLPGGDGAEEEQRRADLVRPDIERVVQTLAFDEACAAGATAMEPALRRVVRTFEYLYSVTLAGVSFPRPGVARVTLRVVGDGGRREEFVLPDLIPVPELAGIGLPPDSYVGYYDDPGGSLTVVVLPLTFATVERMARTPLTDVPSPRSW